MGNVMPLVLGAVIVVASVCARADITLETDHVRWTIGDDGKQQALVVKASGADLIALVQALKEVNEYEAEEERRRVAQAAGEMSGLEPAPDKPAGKAGEEQ